MARKIKCKTKYCRNTIKHNGYCSTCHNRKYRRESPFKYFYNKLKYRAKERGKEFNLCLEQFKLIWLCEPDKWKEKLSDNECKWQMDRIFNNERYHFDNIQLISKKRNIMKYVKHDRFHMEVTWTPRSQNNERAPF